MMKRWIIGLLVLGVICMSFERALAFTLRWEGGYVNDPRDPGGETKYGISQRAYPSLNIKDLTEQEAAEIYRKDYWHRSWADRLPEKLATVHFDTAVNMGVQRAIKFLQLSLCVTPDGVLGLQTATAIAEIQPDREDAIVTRYLQLREQHYVSLCEQRPSLVKYKRGWLNRLEALRNEVA